MERKKKDYAKSLEGLKETCRDKNITLGDEHWLEQETGCLGTRRKHKRKAARKASSKVDEEAYAEYERTVRSK
jgi:predicted  nucleic acid-binding Zn-ribbon protein